MVNNTQLPVGISTQQVIEPRLELYYPVVHGLRSPMVQRGINHRIQNTVKGMLAEQGYYSNPQAEVTASYELKNNQRGILNLSLNNYTFAGGAHGLTIIRSLNFDVDTGKVYSLGDLFKPSEDYEKELSLIIEEQIRIRDIPVLEEFTGIKPEQDFYIADKILVIYFQLYELTPYVYGFPEFPITVYEIENIIDKEGPLGRMIPAIGIG